MTGYTPRPPGFHSDQDRCACGARLRFTATEAGGLTIWCVACPYQKKIDADKGDKKGAEISREGAHPPIPHELRARRPCAKPQSQNIANLKSHASPLRRTS